jgi:orotate phosphoribosyltransferase
MMLGLLLARGGIRVTVLEKHSDFLRDFRGDTVHASTVRLIDELGLGAGFRSLPQSRLTNVAVPVPGAGMVTLAAFDTLKPPYNYVAMMPQWDFLDFLASAAAAEPTFTLLMEAEATGLEFDGGRVTGVRFRGPGGEGEQLLPADVVVAADGRHSVLRQAAGMRATEYPVPFDTWWFKLPRRASEQGEVAGVVPSLGDRDAMIALNRSTYYQMGYLAPKGSDAAIRRNGVEWFRQRVAALRPDLADRVEAISSLDDLHWLDVRLNRLRRWYVDGFLCIGDAAHAMSPAGGVGINLAIQDAVAAAERLVPDLRRGQVRTRTLAAIQRRRHLPTVLVQAVQRILHRAVFVPLFAGKLSGDMLAGTGGRRFPLPRVAFFVLRHNPVVKRLLPRIIAIGPRPEHAPGFARPLTVHPPTKLEPMTSPTQTAANTAAARARLLELIKELAVVRGKVILSSGAEADYYIDLRRITLHHEASKLVGQVMLALADDAGIDFECAGGLTMGADPVGTAVMHAAADAGRTVDAFVVRKAQKSYGMGRQVEGPSVEGRKVLVLEDTSTTGGSALTAVEGVRKAGGNVVAVAVIVDRDTGAKEKIEAETGVPYLFAFGKDELGLS